MTPLIFAVVFIRTPSTRTTRRRCSPWNLESKLQSRSSNIILHAICIRILSSPSRRQLKHCHSLAEAADLAAG